MLTQSSPSFCKLAQNNCPQSIMPIELPPSDVNYLKEVFAENGGVPIWLNFGFRSGYAVDCALGGKWPNTKSEDDCFHKDLAFDDVIKGDQGRGLSRLPPIGDNFESTPSFSLKL